MATDVVMPQMGESIAEGTIVKWLKKVGETIGRDEPLLEVSTDKVDTEVPSPAAGVLVGSGRVTVPKSFGTPVRVKVTVTGKVDGDKIEVENVKM